MTSGSRRTTEDELRDFARLQVRAGLLDDAALHREVAGAITAELPGVDAGVLARAWVARARADLAAEQEGWPAETDHDRLQVAFAACAEAGVPVRQGVEDHWVVKAELDRRATAGTLPRGIAWFTPADVWHAVDEGMLEVNLWHASTANAAPGDALLDEVLACLTRHGLSAHFDEGRIEVGCRWQRRLPEAP